MSKKKYMKSRIQNSMDLVQNLYIFGPRANLYILGPHTESDVFIDFKVVSDF